VVVPINGHSLTSTKIKKRALWQHCTDGENIRKIYT
jgi:hypothetical protein